MDMAEEDDEAAQAAAFAAAAGESEDDESAQVAAFAEAAGVTEETEATGATGASAPAPPPPKGNSGKQEAVYDIPVKVSTVLGEAAVGLGELVSRGPAPHHLLHLVSGVARHARPPLLAAVDKRAARSRSRTC